MQRGRAAHHRRVGAVIDLIGTGQTTHRQRLGGDALARVVALLRQRVVAVASSRQALAAKAHGAVTAHIFAAEGAGGGTGQAHAVNVVGFAVGARTGACGARSLQRGRAAHQRRGGAVIDLIGTGQAAHRQRLGGNGCAHPGHTCNGVISALCPR